MPRALSANKLSDVNEIIRSALDKIQELTTDSYTSIEFNWDDHLIKQLGSIKVNNQIYGPPTKSNKPPNKNKKTPNQKTLPTCTFPPHVKPVVPNYKSKQMPTAHCCAKSFDSKSSKKLNCPGSIAVHYLTGNIYIADTNNHRVQVFNSDAGSLFMFSERMNEPIGICVSQNKVFVTQHDGHCISMYELKGKLIKSVGSEGNANAQFKYPLGLDVLTEITIFMCVTIIITEFKS